MKKIKCPSCDREWYIENDNMNEINFCPYCAEEIRKKAVVEEIDSLGKAIYKAVSGYGVEILLNSHRLMGILSDLAHDLEKEVRIFSKEFVEEYLLIYKNAFSKDILEAEKDLFKIKHLLIENEGLSELWAEKLFQNCLSAIMYVKGEGLPDSISAEITDVILMPELAGEDALFTPMTPQMPVSVTAKPKNRLMKDECGKGETVLGSRYMRASIRSITFLSTLNDMPKDAWDVSEDGSGSVMAWASRSQHTYFNDLFIAANGEIEASNGTKLFAYYRNLRKIEFNGVFNTSHVTDMSSMFFGCNVLEKLDLSGFDTSHVTGMSSMFSRCRALERLDLSGFDTSKVTNMYALFCDCPALEKLDLSSFDTSKVEDMSNMFCGCTVLKKLDLGGFNTSHVTDMSAMFSGCFTLEKLDLSGFDTSHVTDMSAMFSGCFTLKKLDLSSFDTSHVTNMYAMFSGCSALDNYRSLHGDSL